MRKIKKDREEKNQNVSVVLDGRVLEALASKTDKQTDKKKETFYPQESSWSL